MTITFNPASPRSGDTITIEASDTTHSVTHVGLHVSGIADGRAESAGASASTSVTIPGDVEGRLNAHALFRTGGTSFEEDASVVVYKP